MKGQDIKTLRKKLGLSQIQFAQRFGVSKRTVAYWESGKRCPDINAQSKLAELLEQVNQKSVNSDEQVNNDEQVNSKSVNNYVKMNSESVNLGEQVNSDENVTSREVIYRDTGRDDNKTNQTHASGENKTPDVNDEQKLRRKRTGGKRRSPFVQSVLDKIPLEGEIGKDVKLMHSSKKFSGLCPFHNDTHPSFEVYPHTQSWFCYGCQKGGSLIDYVMYRDSVTPAEAIRRLCETYNIPQPSWTEKQKEEWEKTKQEKELIAEINLAVFKRYHDQMPPEQREYYLQLESVKKTPKGAKSTDIESLEAIKDAHPIVSKILRFREIDKLLSTYIFKLPELVDPMTKRIHCNLHQNGTVTGRFSCSEPNLQNIPRGDIIRSAFMPAEGYGFDTQATQPKVFIDADFSQIELRCIAHYTQDENMLAAYHNDADLHKKTIADMLGKSIEDVTEKERFIAKSINFGLAYGMGAKGLSKRLGVSKEEAQSLMDKYFGVYSKVKGYIHQHQIEVQKRGYVVNMFGRRRRMVHGDYHNAFNALIQSTATDICKIQMVRLAEALPEIVKMVLQVHDEILFEVTKEEAETVLEQIVEIMETKVTGLDGNQFSVPIKVEAKVAENWAEAH